MCSVFINWNKASFMKARHCAGQKPADASQRETIPCLVLFLAFFCLGAHGASVVINEIYFHPPDKRPLEFVELYNPASQAVTLTGWALNKFLFPTNTAIEPGGFLVVAAEPLTFEKEFGFKPLGPFESKLKHSGGSVRLEDQNGQVVDEVRYGAGFPWPTAAAGGGSSLERLNPALPGDSP